LANKPKRPTSRPKAPARTEPEPKRDTAKLIKRLGGAAVVVVLIVLIVIVSIPPEDVAAGIPDGAVAVSVGDPRHVDGEIPYDEAIPAGGEHNSIWLNCGVYEEPVREENAVHSLEHGVVWITHRADVATADLDTLRDIGRNRRKVIVSPNEDQATPIMLTAWGWRLDVESADDDRVLQFVAEFTSGAYAPEPLAGCTGGVGTPS
jgi:hypothetical protein